jgi:hypothetical protein
MNERATASPTRTVLVVTDTRHGPTATQKISFAQPFGTGQPSSYAIEFESDHGKAMDVCANLASRNADLLVLSRFTSATGIEWIRAARRAGIPVLFHIDDDLLAVPESLGEAKYSAYNRPERLQALRENIEASDLCYVSTGPLALRFAEHKIRAPIVAGDIYCSVSPQEIGRRVAAATAPVIGYMGTGGHSADLAMIVPSVCETMDLVPALQFELFGSIHMPPELSRFGSRVRHLQPVRDYAQFVPHLRSLGWWVGLAPLEDNPFNRCKADTKWVEYSMSGMAVVASDMPVYRRACSGGSGVLATTGEEWTSAILQLIYRPDERGSIIQAAEEKLRTRYTHELLREQVVKVFNQTFALAEERARASTLEEAAP